MFGLFRLREKPELKRDTIIWALKRVAGVEGKECNHKLKHGGIRNSIREKL